MLGKNTVYTPYCAEMRQFIEDGNAIRIFHYYDIGDQDVYVRPKKDQEFVDPRKAAIYCQFRCEEWFGEEKILNNLGVAAILCMFYGYRFSPKATNLWLEIDMHHDRDAFCGQQFSLLMSDPSLQRNGLRDIMKHFID